jgi:hypothetical protein
VTRNECKEEINFLLDLSSVICKRLRFMRPTTIAETLPS